MSDARVEARIDPRFLPPNELWMFDPKVFRTDLPPIKFKTWKTIKDR